MEESIASLLRPEYIAEAASQWNATGETVLLDEVDQLCLWIQESKRASDFTPHTQFTPYRRRNSSRIGLGEFSHPTRRSGQSTFAFQKWSAHWALPRGRFLLCCNGFWICARTFYRFFQSAGMESTIFSGSGTNHGKDARRNQDYSDMHLKQKRSHWYEDDLLRNAKDYLPADQKQAATDMEKLLARFSHHIPTVESYGLYTAMSTRPISM